MSAFVLVRIWLHVLDMLDRLILAVGLRVGIMLLRALHYLLDRMYPHQAGPKITKDGIPVVWFDSSGLFLPYYIGVAEYLLANYDCTNVCAAGVSGGYAPAATLVMDVTAEDHWAAIELLRRLGSGRWLGAYFFSASEMIHHGYLPALSQPEVEAKMLRRFNDGRLWLGSTVIWPQPGNAIWTNRFASVKELCYACTCSMRTIPILRLPGRLAGALVWDGCIACRPSGVDAQSAELKFLRVSAFPSSRAHISPSRLLGGLHDVVQLPSRQKFDSWRRQGWEDCRTADAAGQLAAAGLVATSAVATVGAQGQACSERQPTNVARESDGKQRNEPGTARPRRSAVSPS